MPPLLRGVTWSLPLLVARIGAAPSVRAFILGDRKAATSTVVPRIMFRRRAPGLPASSSFRSRKGFEIRRSYRPEPCPLCSVAFAETGSLFGALIFNGGISPDRSIAC